jgi:hypothetical protein
VSPVAAPCRSPVARPHFLGSAWLSRRWLCFALGWAVTAGSLSFGGGEKDIELRQLPGGRCEVVATDAAHDAHGLAQRFQRARALERLADVAYLQERRHGNASVAGEEHVGEQRPLHELECPPAGLRVVLQDVGAGDVGRHQVGGELDAPGIEAEHHAQRLHQLGLGKARHTDQQRMATGQDGDHGALDHAFLPEDHPAHAGLHPGNVLQRLFGLSDHFSFAQGGFLDNYAHAAFVPRFEQEADRYQLGAGPPGRDSRPAGALEQLKSVTMADKQPKSDYFVTMVSLKDNETRGLSEAGDAAGLQALISRAAGTGRGKPPVERWNPEFCGDLDMEIIRKKWREKSWPVPEAMTNEGIDFIFPSGFQTTVEEKNLMVAWASSKNADLVIFVYIRPFRIEEQLTFTNDDIIAWRDSISKIHIPADAEGSYIQTETIPRPEHRLTKIGDLVAVETRGYFRSVGDYMGGSFVNFTVFDDENERVIMLDGLVYAPNEKKRNVLMELESMFRSLEISQR